MKQNPLYGKIEAKKLEDEEAIKAKTLAKEKKLAEEKRLEAEQKVRDLSVAPSQQAVIHVNTGLTPGQVKANFSKRQAAAADAKSKKKARLVAAGTAVPFVGCLAAAYVAAQIEPWYFSLILAIVTIISMMITYGYTIDLDFTKHDNWFDFETLSAVYAFVMVIMVLAFPVPHLAMEVKRSSDASTAAWDKEQAANDRKDKKLLANKVSARKADLVKYCPAKSVRAFEVQSEDLVNQLKNTGADEIVEKINSAYAVQMKDC